MTVPVPLSLSLFLSLPAFERTNREGCIVSLSYESPTSRSRRLVLSLNSRSDHGHNHDGDRPGEGQRDDPREEYLPH
jgi:hypothetical protein